MSAALCADRLRSTIFEFPDSNLNESLEARGCARLSHPQEFRWLSALPRIMSATNTEKPLRILLVEDNEIIGNALRDHIRASGWTIDWVAELQSATMATEAAHYALILLDLHLPDGSGLDLLRRLQGHPEMVPVIILSAYDQVSDRMEGLELGAIDYLVKPFDLSELVARIDLFIDDQKRCGASLGQSLFDAQISASHQEIVDRRRA